MLGKMLGQVTAMQLYCIRLGRLIDDGKMSDTMASLAKCFCTVKARHVCHLARDVLGGNVTRPARCAGCARGRVACKSAS